MSFWRSSEKLKPFWLSISEVDVSVVAVMSNYLQSRDTERREYRCAVSRALAITSCKLVPFFGTFLRDLRAILANVPAIVVFPTNAEHSLEVRSLIVTKTLFLTVTQPSFAIDREFVTSAKKIREF